MAKGGKQRRVASEVGEAADGQQVVEEEANDGPRLRSIDESLGLLITPWGSEVAVLAAVRRASSGTVPQKRNERRAAISSAVGRREPVIGGGSAELDTVEEFGRLEHRLDDRRDAGREGRTFRARLSRG